MNISMWDGWCEVIGHVGNLCSVYETGQIAYGTRIVRWKKTHDSHVMVGLWDGFYDINGLPRIFPLYLIISHIPFYIPFYIVIYRYISLYIVIYRYISLYIVIYRYISLYIVIYRYISLHIVTYRYISLYIVVYRYISLYIVIYRYISLYIVIFQCHEKSTDHVHDMRIRSNIWGFLHRRAPSDQSSLYFGQNPPLLVEPCRCSVGFAQRNWQIEQIWTDQRNMSVTDQW